MITDQTFTRRQVLQGTTRFGLTLALAAVLGASPRPTQAQQAPKSLNSHGIDILREPDVQHWIGTGLGGCGLQANFSTLLLTTWSLRTCRESCNKSTGWRGASTKACPRPEKSGRRSLPQFVQGDRRNYGDFTRARTGPISFPEQRAGQRPRTMGFGGALPVTRAWDLVLCVPCT